MNKFIFNNVGQGLFYSGHIENNKYNFVFDCGSVSQSKYINQSIDNFLSSKTIDFVVISHLHADHINGLKRLFGKYTINKLYLPYLGRSNNSLVKLLISGALLTGYPTDATIITREFDNQIDDKILEDYQFIKSFYIPDLLTQTRTNVEFIGIEGERLNRNDNRKYFSRKHFSIPLLNNSLWEFTMFNIRQSDADLNLLNAKIDSKLKLHGVKDVDELVKRNKIKDIIQIYKDIFEKKGSDLNLTSTILVHNPLGTTCFNHLYGGYYYTYDEPMCGVKPITILTGDALFDAEMLNRINDELAKHNDVFSIFQIPHHGSKKNWDSLTSSHKFIFNHYVIPFGLGNKYHHPHKDVINELSTIKTNAVSLVTELNPFIYYIG
jgi:beta-lactamase superfamily II metal-dependent hydrolase